MTTNSPTKMFKTKFILLIIFVIPTIYCFIEDNNNIFEIQTHSVFKRSTAFYNKNVNKKIDTKTAKVKMEKFKDQLLFNHNKLSPLPRANERIKKQFEQLRNKLKLQMRSGFDTKKNHHQILDLRKNKLHSSILGSTHHNVSTSSSTIRSVSITDNVKSTPSTTESIINKNTIAAYKINEIDQKVIPENDKTLEDLKSSPIIQKIDAKRRETLDKIRANIKNGNFTTSTTQNTLKLIKI